MRITKNCNGATGYGFSGGGVYWPSPAEFRRYLAQLTPFVMLRIESTAELDKLRNQKRAVVFLWVDWAIHARQSASIAERMIAEWNREYPNADIDLLQVDVSEQSGDMWDAVAGWFESQRIPDAGSLIYGGAGSIIWVRSGTIMQYVINANAETLDGLLALMSQSFGTPETNEAK